MKVVVVGSGLAAVGTIRALVSRGIRPTVLDIGDTLPHAQQNLRRRLAALDPKDWSEADWTNIRANDGNYGRVVPKKLVLGSDYFYAGGAMNSTPTSGPRPGLPPWSGARGGFSVGWGAAVLPPAKSDLDDWPITHGELMSNARNAILGIPVSEPVDELTEVFGRVGDDIYPVLKLTPGQERLLRIMQETSQKDVTKKTLVGQSRLLTDTRHWSQTSCRHCGSCSSGCVYGSIYSAEHDFEQWILREQIEYFDQAEVIKISETNRVATVFFRSASHFQSIDADRVFLAAGAVSSARVLVNSSPVDITSITLYRTGGVIQLFVGTRRFEHSWPQMNTQTSHLLELLRPEISPRWAHVQVGQPNELVLQRLGIRGWANPNLRERIASEVACRMVTTMLNVNSELGPTYELRFERGKDGLHSVMTTQSWPDHARRRTHQFAREVTRFMRNCGFKRFPFAKQDSTASTGYHFGASFPMSHNPTSAFETDTLGRPFGWERTHVVDTSILPSIPASGIGLIVMANAHRIALQSV